MNDKIIEIMDNGGEPFAHTLTVTEKQYETLEYLENYGGVS